MIVGQMVFSKSGRDKGLPFIVCAIENNFVYLIDGKLRKIETPKKKKVIHIQKTNYISSLAKNLSLIYNPSYDVDKANKLMLKNSDIRTEIKAAISISGKEV